MVSAEMLVDDAPLVDDISTYDRDLYSWHYVLFVYDDFSK